MTIDPAATKREIAELRKKLKEADDLIRFLMKQNETLAKMNKKIVLGVKFSEKLARMQ